MIAPGLPWHDRPIGLISPIAERFTGRLILAGLSPCDVPEDAGGRQLWQVLAAIHDSSPFFQFFLVLFGHEGRERGAGGFGRPKRRKISATMRLAVDDDVVDERRWMSSCDPCFPRRRTFDYGIHFWFSCFFGSLQPFRLFLSGQWIEIHRGGRRSCLLLRLWWFGF